MKKIKRIFIILLLSITLFTSSYERVDAVAIPIGIGLKAIITYGLVAVGGLVAVDYALNEDLEKAQAQQMYLEYTDTMEEELEDYVAENDWDEIFNDFKKDNNNKSSIFGVEWNDDIKRLFKDFSNHIRSKFQEFPTEHAFFDNYGTISDYLDDLTTLKIRNVYSEFLSRDYGALFVFKNTNANADENDYCFVYGASSEIVLKYQNIKYNKIQISRPDYSPSIYYAYFDDPSSYQAVSLTTVMLNDYDLIDVWEHDGVIIDSVIDLPVPKSIDDIDKLKKEGLLIGGNKDIKVQDAQWVDDVKKKGKSIDDVDIMHLDGDMDVDGNYIPSNTIPVIPDDVWIDALEKNIPWDKLIQYPDVILHDDDDVVVNEPDYPDNTKPDVYVPKNIDFGDNPEIVRTDLKMVFPFCIPFDLIDAIKLFNAPPKAPVFEIPVPMGEIGHETITIDMQEFESLAQIFRIFMTIMFIMSLIVITRQIIKG